MCRMRWRSELKIVNKIVWTKVQRWVKNILLLLLVLLLCWLFLYAPWLTIKVSIFQEIKSLQKVCTHSSLAVRIHYFDYNGNLMFNLFISPLFYHNGRRLHGSYIVKLFISIYTLKQWSPISVAFFLSIIFLCSLLSCWCCFRYTRFIVCDYIG